MKQLIAYLRENLIVDFKGELTVDMVRHFLREDDSPSARAVLGTLAAERSADPMLMALAKGLEDRLRSLGTVDETLHELLCAYSRN